MKWILLIALVVCLTQEVLMYSQPCVARRCSTEKNPVCGMQKIGGKWEKKMFDNSCIMESANDCGQANYIPCKDNGGY